MRPPLRPSIRRPTADRRSNREIHRRGSNMARRIHLRDHTRRKVAGPKVGDHSPTGESSANLARVRRVRTGGSIRAGRAKRPH